MKIENKSKGVHTKLLIPRLLIAQKYQTHYQIIAKTHSFHSVVGYINYLILIFLLRHSIFTKWSNMKII